MCSEIETYRFRDNASNAMSLVRVSIVGGRATPAAPGGWPGRGRGNGNGNGSDGVALGAGIGTGAGAGAGAETGGGAALPGVGVCVGGSMPVFLRAFSSAMGSDGRGVEGL